MHLDTYLRKEGYRAPARVAREAGIHYTTLANIRLGKTKPTAKNALAISKATGGAVTVEDLCSGPPPKPKRKRRAS